MLQLIEAGRANPSLGIIQKLNSALNLELSIRAKFSKAEVFLAHLGLLHRRAGISKLELGSQNLQLWVNAVQSENLLYEDPRLAEAFSGFCLCVCEYYPSLAKKLRFKIEEIKITGRIIKLKRMALPGLMEILKS
jgi:transcriptional regulator with XRE-family HTH domain